MLITDALINLQRMERLLGVLDRPSPMRNVTMLFFQLRHTSAQDVLRRLQQMQQGPLRRQLENNTTFDADDRSNQIIVFTHPANEALIRQLMEQLD
ncbi:secretin N-terminal domain-containing protein, partial [Arthrospira platensis SPKY1]|nr:secretin N-terminal domain-containing protein [Arthrospira platensis SPKY1]